jgi:HEAT repeat protein
MGKLWLGLALIGALLVVGGVVVNFRLGRSAPRLDDPDPAVRAAAVRGITGDRHILVKMLDDEDPDVRLLVVERLGDAEALVRALKDEHAGVRREAAYCLAGLGAAACPAICKALEDESPRVRAAGALAVMSIRYRKDYWGPAECKAFSSALKRLRNDRDPDVRRQAAEALRYVVSDERGSGKDDPK